MKEKNYNKSFLSFTISVNEELAIDFQENEERDEEEKEEGDCEPSPSPPKKGRERE